MTAPPGRRPDAATVRSVCLVTELQGGVGVYAVNLLRGLMAAGIEVTVLTPQPHTSPAPRTIAVPEVTGRGRFFTQAAKFAEVYRRERITADVVHVTDARYAWGIRGQGAPVIGTMNDHYYAGLRWWRPGLTRSLYQDWIVRHAFYNAVRLFERPTLRRLDGVVCVSRVVADVLSDEYGVARDRLHVVNLGIDAPPGSGIGDSVLDDLRVATSPERAPRILFLGGNFQRKGLGVLVRSVETVRGRLPAAEVFVAGASRDHDLIAEQLRELRLEECVHLLGGVPHERVAGLFSESTVFTMPSLIESFGIPFLEAMHHGVPVVATRIPGPSDFLVDDVNCLLVEPGDADALGDALIRVSTDRELRERLVREGRRTALSASVGRMVEQTLDAYRDVRSRWNTQ